MRSGAIAFRPNCPNDNVAPEVATPWIRPLCAFRNFVFFGCIMAYALKPFLFRSSSVATRPRSVALGHLLVLRHRVVLKDFALEDPDLDAAGAERGERGRHAVIDIGAQRGVEFRLADFDDVDDDVGRGDIGNALAQLVDVGALLADHDAGTRRVDRHAALLVRTLDHYPGDGRLLQFLVQHLADFDILVQQLAVLVLAGVPTGIPCPVDAETQSDWIDLLTHRSLPRPVRRSPRPDEQRSSAARMV